MKVRFVALSTIALALLAPSISNATLVIASSWAITQSGNHSVGYLIPAQSTAAGGSTFTCYIKHMEMEAFPAIYQMSIQINGNSSTIAGYYAGTETSYTNYWADYPFNESMFNMGSNTVTVSMGRNGILCDTMQIQVTRS